jgi:hypothetical protein
MLAATLELASSYCQQAALTFSHTTIKLTLSSRKHFPGKEMRADHEPLRRTRLLRRGITALEFCDATGGGDHTGR